uniref:RING-type domain-containing protein n=1 Tax=Macrostomum lignano TaxID=282301 RepID=A0A1I8FMB2_9PLAT
PSRLTLDNPIHMALNLRRDNSVRSYLPAEMLSSRQAPLPLPPLVSTEFCVDPDFRGAPSSLSRASIEEQQQQQPRARRPRSRGHVSSSGSRRTAMRVADPAPFAQAAPDSDGDEEGIDRLASHERLGRVSDPHSANTSRRPATILSKSRPAGLAAPQSGEKLAAANGGHYAVDQHSFDDLAEHGDFKSRVGRGAKQAVSAAVASAASPRKRAAGGSEPPPLSLLHQLSPADAVDNFDAEVAAVSRRRRNHPSASSRLGAGESVRMAPTPPASAAAFDEERRSISCASCAKARAKRRALRTELLPPALRGCADGDVKEKPPKASPRLRREHATALAREARQSLTPYPVTGAKEQAPEQQVRFFPGLDSVLGSDGRRSPTEALRQSLADLERRQLIDSLPQARDSMGGGGGGGGGDAQLAEIRNPGAALRSAAVGEATGRDDAIERHHVPSVGRPSTAGRVAEDKQARDADPTWTASHITGKRNFSSLLSAPPQFQISSGFTHQPPSSAMEPPGPGRHHLRLLPEAHGQPGRRIRPRPATRSSSSPEEAVAAAISPPAVLGAAARLERRVRRPLLLPSSLRLTSQQQQQQLSADCLQPGGLPASSICRRRQAGYAWPRPRPRPLLLLLAADFVSAAAATGRSLSGAAASRLLCAQRAPARRSAWAATTVASWCCGSRPAAVRRRPPAGAEDARDTSFR